MEEWGRGWLNGGGDVKSALKFMGRKGTFEDTGLSVRITGRMIENIPSSLFTGLHFSHTKVTDNRHNIIIH